MADKTIRKTWNEFWGDMLMLRFHRDNPERWSKRAERAEWLFNTLRLKPGVRILDLGCGDGILDICLARLGAKVTAVDRISPVIDAARAEAGAEAVNFITGNVKEMAFTSESFDAVMMFEFAGLMSSEDDALLIQSARRWLAPHGQIMIDCPVEKKEIATVFQKEFSDGVLEISSTYDPATRIQHISPMFHTKAGAVIELYDPLNSEKSGFAGVRRYLYPEAELRGILTGNAFNVREVEHFRAKDYYMLLGE